MNHLKRIEQRDAARDIQAELLEGLQEMAADMPAASHRITQTDVALARQKAQMSQASFAKTLGVSVRTLESWEQGARRPSGAARSLIKLFIKHPEFVREALS
ncbi:helix-turn-helix domain-containing protein [Thiopseudomonas denitrificans]|uniref:Xre family transcriptional regulator n=1 Tax=Thiopseudomonas denitrificans TaxID=1501432 RepID=A0A4R6U0V2_9GAMM|nr:helix-turn-helix domain-containing protein [Thiopseudomonas denitrificans]TDQ39968.1 Xre family transcriptional regulator [Thiopseudomonas denitrificans]